MTISRIPVFCNQLCDSTEEAWSVARADIALAFCRCCGHLFNAAFEPEKLEYDTAYENSLHFSPRFQAYAEELAQSLTERYRLEGKTALEIGCGAGEFLIQLCRHANCRGYGLDPSFSGAVEAPAGVDVTIDNDALSSDASKIAQISPDLVLCRHVLEHIARPTPFLRTVRSALGTQDETAVFFEVPNGRFTLSDGGIWDLIYEHCSYFTDISLRHAFEHAGFQVTELSQAFEGQFLTIHGRPGSSAQTPATRDTTELDRKARSFADFYRDKLTDWQTHLDALAARGGQATVWGIGSKGTTFLNVLQPSCVDAVVDINPRKHGRFVAGTGQPIVAPEELATYRPDTVIVMNSIYIEEIRSQLRDLGLQPEILVA